MQQQIALEQVWRVQIPSHLTSTQGGSDTEGQGNTLRSTRREGLTSRPSAPKVCVSITSYKEINGKRQGRASGKGSRGDLGVERGKSGRGGQRTAW